MLTIYLLGTPRFEKNGTSIHIGRRKSVALAAYLACAGQPVGRETLAALLWPEHDQAAALKGLRRELARLKRALGAENVTATRSHLALNKAGGITVDIVSFQQHLQLVKDHDHFPDSACRLCLDALNATVKLHNGEFMAGFNLPDCPEFDSWQDFRRESTRRGLSRALHRLVKWHVIQQEYERAIEYGRRWLAEDPFHEGARRTLMLAYAEAGQQAAGLRVYEEGVALLQAELGIVPNAETTQLAESIRAGRLTTGGKMSTTPTVQPAARPLPHNLPCPTTPFVGRAHELTMTQLRLEEAACRLLTLVGPTGIGKTRLALEVGRILANNGSHLFGDGVVFVPLADVDGPEAMIAAIMQAAKLTHKDSAPGEQQLLAALHDRQLLFILDNLEHLPEAGGLTSRILAGAPHVKILATSCRALRLREEWSHPLHGLSVPPAGGDEEMEAAAAYDAVQLFIQRARQVSPSFSTAEELAHVVRICRLVEGMPLALELAAGWIDVLDAGAIAGELEQGLDLLQARCSNVPPRQQSMRAGFRQTWSVLNRVEQEALARLSLFPESFTREEAARVGGANLAILSSLLEKSLVQPAGSQRFRLPQLLRHFAGGELERWA